jgi:tRNA(Ile)-lysidine synthase TilS/MesJ
LLCCTKQEIITELEKNGINYLVDPTNTSDQFLRNRIRMNVIPALRECDARFDESITRTMENLRSTDDFLQQHTEELFNECTYIHIKEHNESLWMNYDLLLQQHPFMQKRILLHWLITANVQFTPSQALFDEMLRFLHNNKSNQHTFYNAWNIIKKGEEATISVE